MRLYRDNLCAADFGFILEYDLAFGVLCVGRAEHVHRLADADIIGMAFVNNKYVRGDYGDDASLQGSAIRLRAAVVRRPGSKLRSDLLNSLVSGLADLAAGPLVLVEVKKYFLYL